MLSLHSSYRKSMGRCNIWSSISCNLQSSMLQPYTVETCWHIFLQQNFLHCCHLYWIILYTLLSLWPSTHSCKTCLYNWQQSEVKGYQLEPSYSDDVFDNLQHTKCGPFKNDESWIQIALPWNMSCLSRSCLDNVNLVYSFYPKCHEVFFLLQQTAQTSWMFRSDSRTSLYLIVMCLIYHFQDKEKCQWFIPFQISLWPGEKKNRTSFITEFI